MLTIVVAVSHNNVIGSKNDLPWYLPADLKHFKDITTSHSVVMGRTTFQSIISRIGKPLPNRQNIVVTRNPNFTYFGVTVINSVDDIKKFNDVMVIGGAEIYQQTIDIADKLYVTEVHADIEGDTFFPEIDLQKWRETSRETHQKDAKNQYDYDFVVYERI